MKKSLVAMIGALLLAMATAAPVLAVPPTAPSTDTAVRPQVSLVSMVWDWLAGLVPVPAEPGLHSAWAAGNSAGNGDNGGSTATCELCPIADSRVIADPDA